MITNIEINDLATFQNSSVLEELREFNYFFGPNGSGKTSISRVIGDPEQYSSCSVSWKNQIPLETCVYNRDFVDLNFEQKFKGVFTLGETAKETLETIKKTKGDIDELKEKIIGLKNTLQGSDGKGGKKSELNQLNQEYKDKFFKMKQEYSDSLSGNQSGEGMSGFIGSKERFMGKVLLESKNNTAALISQPELEEKAETIFSNAFTKADSLPEIDTASILRHEKNLILSKRIIGKDDVDIAAMILKLNNSDWVRQGISYYEANDGACPFCQQSTEASFHKNLSEYFDDAYTEDSNAVRTLISDYAADSQRLKNQIQGLINLESIFLDTEKIKAEKQLLDSIIVINEQRLAEKQKEASQIISLDSHKSILKNVEELIVAAEAKINENNRILGDIKNEKAALTNQIWKFITSELDTDITEYNRKKDILEKAISNIDAQIKLKKTEKVKNETELSKLEKQITSIEPTRVGINKLLKKFGFNSFSLGLGDEVNTYKLVREDGSDAKDTLSEGEKNFLTFLYFYHLLQGSQSETGISNDKIVVIDDPISSLDNDVLFIVSTLIRELIQAVREDKGAIKQIFILTHNIYFHKEVAFNKKRSSGKLNEETFWLVKKSEKFSVIEKHLENPIKTSYELLWHEVQDDNRNNATIQNTLRRILEYYFKLLGGIPLDNLYKKFEGEDKIKCKALCSWINDGSHSSFDEDFYTPLDDAMVDKYLDVFKQIFQETDHIAHYNMMMGTAAEGS